MEHVVCSWNVFSLPPKYFFVILHSSTIWTVKNMSISTNVYVVHASNLSYYIFKKTPFVFFFMFFLYFFIDCCCKCLSLIGIISVVFFIVETLKEVIIVRWKIGTLLEDCMSMMVSNYKDNHLVSNAMLRNYSIFLLFLLNWILSCELCVQLARTLYGHTVPYPTNCKKCVSWWQ